MFYYLGFKSLDVSNFNSSNVINMISIFEGCISVTSLDVSIFDISKAQLWPHTYRLLYLVSLDLSNFDTSNAMVISVMFLNCESITSIDISSFNTGKLKRISSLFNSCKQLLYIDISSFRNTIGYNNKIFENLNKSEEIIVNKNISTIISNIFEDLNMSWTITEI